VRDRLTKRLPVAFHPFLPRFNDARLERQYRDSRAEYRLSAIRIGCFAGIAIWVLFTSLDRLTIHDPSAPLFYVRILGIISLIPIIVATFVLRLGRWLEPIGFTALAIQVPLLIGVLAFLSPVSLPYYQPIEVWTLIGVASFVLCGVSFVEGSTLRSVIVSGRAGISPRVS
jgi:4-amino-4-deoxy-L-arabinose transferase-like glycosyltransferase